jgi:hypothetical protein
MHDYHVAPDVVAAARNLIHNEGDACVVSIGQLLEVFEQLSGTFGNRLPVSPDMYKLVGLIETLWADPHIDQVPNSEVIEFAWNEKGRWDDEAPSLFLQEPFAWNEKGSIRSPLLGRFQIPSAPVEEI